MSPLIIVLSAVTVAFAVATVALRRKGRSFDGMVCKFMASFGFISVAIVGYVANEHNAMYFCLVLFGLLFGLGGDVMLGIKEIAPKFRPKLIPLGTVYFLVSHVFFLVAFLRTSGFKALPLIIALAMGASAAIVSKLLKFMVNPKLHILLTVYFTILCYKMTTAAYIVFISPSSASIVALVGAILFIISDTCLAFLYFTPIKRKNVFVSIELSTYYPAQILLAMSVALMSA